MAKCESAVTIKVVVAALSPLVLPLALPFQEDQGDRYKSSYPVPSLCRWAGGCYCLPSPDLSLQGKLRGCCRLSSLELWPFPFPLVLALPRPFSLEMARGPIPFPISACPSLIFPFGDGQGAVTPFLLFFSFQGAVIKHPICVTSTISS